MNTSLDWLDLGVVELASDLVARLEQRNLVPALGSRAARRKARAAAAHHGDLELILGCDWLKLQLGLVPGSIQR